MNIYVGNLAYTTDETKLKNTFQEFGPVVSAKIIKDKFTGSSKGFGFVEMEQEEDANQAIQELNGKQIDGRTLRVNKAHPQERQNTNRTRGPRRF